jgi:hypothetical protein
MHARAKLNVGPKFDYHMDGFKPYSDAIFQKICTTIND